MRGTRTFGRRAAYIEPEKRILVICEDSKSCLVYLQEAKRFFHAQALIEVCHLRKTDPYGIVSEAKSASRRGSYDEVYCVIDRDAHPRWKEALEAARVAKNVVVIPSYPCFEFWLRLHFDGARPLYAAQGNKSVADMVLEDLLKLPMFSVYKKNNCKGLFERLIDYLEPAKIRSKSIIEKIIDDGDRSPSTHIHELIEKFEEIGRPPERR